MVTMLLSGPQMLNKKQSKGNNFKRNKVELWFLYTALQVITKNMHTKFEVIWTYGDKVTLQTRNAL